MHHVVVPATPAAIFSELDSCEGQAAVGQLKACAPGLLPSGRLSRKTIALGDPALCPGEVTFYRTPPFAHTGEKVALDS